jgi:hypothetical protein
MGRRGRSKMQSHLLPASLVSASRLPGRQLFLFLSAQKAAEIGKKHEENAKVLFSFAGGKAG